MTKDGRQRYLRENPKNPNASRENRTFVRPPGCPVVGQASETLEARKNFQVKLTAMLPLHH